MQLCDGGWRLPASGVTRERATGGAGELSALNGSPELETCIGINNLWVGHGAHDTEKERYFGYENQVKTKNPRMAARVTGGDDGNRTRVFSLEG